jgi:DNA-binding response OmpR family regulator
MQHILIIDDDAAITKVLKRGLSYGGFAVETAASGAEGLTIACEHPSDLVILEKKPKLDMRH